MVFMVDAVHAARAPLHDHSRKARTADASELEQIFAVPPMRLGRRTNQLKIHVAAIRGRRLLGGLVRARRAACCRRGVSDFAFFFRWRRRGSWRRWSFDLDDDEFHS